MSDILCPRCPMCDSPPREVLLLTWPVQAWCSNDNCDLPCWDATRTLDENILNIRIQRSPETRPK